jgi:hypothetical protein
VRIAGAIVNDGFLLNAFFGDGEGKMNYRLLWRRCVSAGFLSAVLDRRYSFRWRCEHADLERV